MKKLLLSTLLAAMAVSCNQKTDYFEPEQDATIKFVLNLSEPQEVATYSSYGTNTDQTVNSIDMLVFNSGQFVNRVKVDIAGMGTGNPRTVYATLPAGGARTIHFVINGREVGTPDVDLVNFDAITAGMTEAAVATTLKTSTPLTATTAGDIAPLVMWGRAVLSTVTAGQSYSVNILRVAASIEITKNASLTDFVIQSATVQNTAASAYIMPSNYTVSPTAQPTTGNPLAGNSDYYTNETTGFWANGPTPRLYVYEKNNTSANYLSVIIKATYNGVSGYYKVVLHDNSSNSDHNADGLFDIIRNHKYKLNITAVTGPGNPDFANAVAGAPTNHLWTIVEDSGDEFVSFVSDGNNYLAISNDVFEVWGTGAANELIATVYSSGAAPTVSTTGGGITSLVCNSLGSNRYDIRGNTTGLTSGTITVTSGNLSLTIDASRTVAPAYSSSGTTRMATNALLVPANRPWKAEFFNTSTNSGVLSLNSNAGFSYSNTLPLASIDFASASDPFSSLYSRIAVANDNCYYYYLSTASPVTMRLSGNFSGALKVKRIVHRF